MVRKVIKEKQKAGYIRVQPIKEEIKLKNY